MEYKNYEKYFEKQLFSHDNMLLILTIKTASVKDKFDESETQINRVQIIPNYKDITKSMIILQEYDAEDDMYYTVERLTNNKRSRNFNIFFQGVHYSFVEMPIESKTKVIKALHKKREDEIKKEDCIDYEMLEVLLKNVIGAKDRQEVCFDLVV